MGKLGFDDARHLVSRTGIGAEWETIMRYQNLTRQQAINHLFNSRDMKLPPAPPMSPWHKMVALRGNMNRRKNIKRISRVEGKLCKNGG